MKRYFAITAVLLGCIGLTANAQSMDETYSWLTSFVNQHDGIRVQLQGNRGWAWFITEDGIADHGNHGATRLMFANMSKVAEWHSGNVYYVRISGTCEGGCDEMGGHVDLELRDEPTSEETDRMMKAIIHLAELHGAKVNQKEVF